jgi:hypothetical protein
MLTGVQDANRHAISIRRKRTRSTLVDPNSLGLHHLFLQRAKASIDVLQPIQEGFERLLNGPKVAHVGSADYGEFRTGHSDFINRTL